jgi:hypothetical protein
MNQYDPTSTEATSAESSFREMTVEEMEALDVMHAADLEPTQASTRGEGAAQAAAVAAIPTPSPIVPVPLIKQAVSGRYRGATGAFQLEVRVDVDRVRPMKRVSGDFFQVSGATTTYFGSFIVNAPTITVTPTQVIIKGLGSYTFSAGAPVVRVTIQRRTIFQPLAPAVAQFFTTGGAPGATYTCAFESVYFRTVRIETDRVSDVATPVFSNYNTGSLPSGGPARSLSVVSAYAEAGIQMVPTAGSDVINMAEAGDAKWSNAELHASMQKHFTLWKDLPQWAVWEVVAQLHDLGPGLYGIMFDQQGKQRQGCAVFHRGIGGSTADLLRLQLYTYVHELGHCFNLLHSWQKSFASPPVANRPNALSWMNYPWNYPLGGAAAFWNAFPFQFDNDEVIHVRHAFRNNVIMGGSNFAVGSALGREIMADSTRDESNLNFRISTHQNGFALGEPVVLQLELGTIDPRGRRVHTWLHPNYGLVTIAIRKPSGDVWFYAPLIDHVVGPRDQEIGPGDSIQDSAYIGFGKGGLHFDQPGRYQIRAVYPAIDGSQVLSNILDVRVRYPVTAAEEEVADLFMGEEQGTLLYLLGSDADSLRRGNAAFDEVLAKYPKHAMASYARLVKGINAGRDFKTITPDRPSRLAVRPSNGAESMELLAAVADSGVLDSVSAEMTLSKLAEVQAKSGDDKAAAKTRSRLVKAGAPAVR